MSLPVFPAQGGGALLGEEDLPEPTRAQLDAGGEALEQSADAVWVPNRNGVLVEVAAAHASRIPAWPKSRSL